MAAPHWWDVSAGLAAGGTLVVTVGGVAWRPLRHWIDTRIESRTKAHLHPLVAAVERHKSEMAELRTLIQQQVIAHERFADRSNDTFGRLDATLAGINQVLDRVEGILGDIRTTTAVLTQRMGSAEERIRELRS